MLFKCHQATSSTADLGCAGTERPRDLEAGSRHLSKRSLQGGITLRAPVTGGGGGGGNQDAQSTKHSLLINGVLLSGRPQLQAGAKTRLLLLCHLVLAWALLSKPREV